MRTLEKTTVLETPRLLLRRMVPEDATMIAKFCNDKRVSEMTTSMPHPYTREMAEDWLRLQKDQLQKTGEAPFAITLKLGGEFIGVIELCMKPDGLTAEVGYWLAPLFWGHGIMTEALREIIRYGFEEKNLKRIEARYFTGNPASGRVQEKAGMRKEGLHKWGATRFGEMRDCIVRAIIRPDWEKKKILQ